MMFPLVLDLAANGGARGGGLPGLKISRAGYYGWRDRPPSARSVGDANLSQTIARVHRDSRGAYGSPRGHAELRLGLGLACGRKRVARLMRAAGLRGVCHQRKHRHWKPDPATHTPT